ncbi:MAG: hypothetical protein QM537_10035, partial [Candidatus Symbiobacter sp.]|nr:hypothetical protein [Candidatus Symbiobacter sp.]
MVQPQSQATTNRTESLGRNPPPELPLFNRELSWLYFNHRILDEAENSRHPILERVRFLAIAETNLDEFFMVRVAGLKGQIKAGISTRSDDGKSPAEQLTTLRQAAHQLGQRYDRIFAQLRAELAENYATFLTDDIDDDFRMSLDPAAWQQIEDIFERDYFPLLTPVVFDLAQPFPYIGSGGLAMVMRL